MTEKFSTGSLLRKEVEAIFQAPDWPFATASMIGRGIAFSWRKWRNFNGSHGFIDRSKGSQRLLIVLAGYKDFLWSLTLTRLAKFVPTDMDVCIVSSGLFSEHLAEFAASSGWSYLHTKENKVSLGQNLAISKHQKAEFIYKLDEDMFISQNFFEQLLEGYLQIKQEGLYNPGFCAPLINVNGYSYVNFLKMLGADDAYKAEFGELRRAAIYIKAQNDGEAAKWLWKKSLPFDQIASYVASQPFNYSTVPHRFSIGAILFEREFWESIGGFHVAFKERVLGIDETYLCKDCVEKSRVMSVIHNVFAGHFSFGPQEAAMREFLPEIYSQLDVKEVEMIHI